MHLPDGAYHTIYDPKYLHRQDMFSIENDKVIIATKDLATESIKESLLNASNLGQEQLERFVEERLIKGEDNDCPEMLLNEPLTRNNADTFNSLYDTEQKKTPGEGVNLKADRNVMQQLVCSYSSGIEVNLSSIVQHELMSYLPC